MNTKAAPKRKLNKFWPKFQAYLGNTIPEFIVKILISAGYDSALSIADLNDDDIAVIENHVSQKSTDLLQNSDLYSETGPFQFLPGHRKLLLTLKSRAISFIEDNKKPKAEVETNDFEEFELLNEQEVEVLKNELLKKLSAVSHTIGLGLKFEDKNIVTSIDAYISKHSKTAKHSKKSKTPSYKCSVQCVKCDRVIPCTYNNRWEIRNIELHLRTHAPLTTSQKTSQNKITNTNQESTATVTTKSTTQTTKSTTQNTKSNLSEDTKRQLNDILRL